MGLIRDKFVKDPKKKEIMTWAINIFIVIFLIGVALYAKQEWTNGYNYCKDNCLMMRDVSVSNFTGMNGTVFNITTNIPISVMTVIGSGNIG